MSKKDYQAIAAAIYRIRQSHPAFSQSVDGATAADLVTEALADIFKADNSNFSRERFAEACETGRTRGMKQVA